MKTYKIKNLHFKFAFPKLDAQQIADALSRAGLIELIPHESLPIFEHYRETSKLHSIPEDQYELFIEGVLNQYIADQGLE